MNVQCYGCGAELPQMDVEDGNELCLACYEESLRAGEAMREEYEREVNG
jgi:hypothetical protein